MEKLVVAIFGPTDCQAEKQRLKRLIAEDQGLRLIASKFGLILQSCSAEDVTSGPGRPQARINATIAEMEPDLSIFIFNRSFGSDAGEGATGTEEEWRIAIETLQSRPEFDLGLYFKRSADEDPRLTDFRERIELEHTAFYKQFGGLADFEAQIRHKLVEFITRYASKKNDEPQRAIASIIKALSASPLSLSNYPRTLPGGEELVRSELQELLDQIHNTNSSVSILLGERGSGKSALLASLFSRLKEEGTTVLSIKADLIESSVRNEGDLDRSLDLPLGLKASIQLAASERTVVVIVDQLDALADILDRRTVRLNVLLDVIRTLAGMVDVHVVVSSRPFEFHHDARLRSIEAERIDLELPAWSDIAPILDRYGYSADSITEPVRELLRNPWALNEFLSLRPKTINFGSLFGLLEENWAATVDAQEAPEGTSELVQELVNRMADEEVLWLPRAVSSNQQARKYLEGCGIIRLDDAHVRIGFRHQSYFEFALVRRFVTEEASFSDYVLEKSDRLFVRPVALAGLAYLRGTTELRYEKELNRLWESNPRPHLGMLILDFVASQSEPLPTEIGIIRGMLSDDTDGPRALAAIGPYSQWFPVLRSTAEFRAWLRRPPVDAAHATGLLARGAESSLDDVLDLIEREWSDPSYDSLTFSVLYNLASWSDRAIDLLLRIVPRSDLNGVYDLARKLIDSNLGFAARVLRAELDKRLERLAADFAEASHSDLEHAVERLMEDDEHTGVFSELSEESPIEFLRHLFPWVVSALELTAFEKDPRFQQYRHGGISTTSYGSVPPPELLWEMTRALERTASDDPAQVLDFLRSYFDGEVMGVHALLVHGLRVIAATQPSAVFDYLLLDRKRLAIGTLFRAHQFSKLLLESLIPHLEEEQVRELESAILNYDYCVAPDDDLTDEQRERKEPWNREHRLFLLQSVPDKRLSGAGLQYKRELDAEHSGLREEIFGEIKGGTVQAQYDAVDLKTGNHCE